MRRLALSTLIINLGVILWGAVVRATGSGAGCGDDWPLCAGELVPSEGSSERWIEYSHRLSSGIALFLGAALWWAARRSRPPGHPLRRATYLALLFLGVEAGLGAMLVLYGWVAEDASPARAWVMPLHLVNTLLLLAALTLAVHHASEARPVRLRGVRPHPLPTAGVFLLLLLAGATGAVAALAATLYPAQSLAEGFAHDLAGGSPGFVRWRWLHLPVALVAAGSSLWWLALVAEKAPGTDATRTRTWARWSGWIVLAQLLVGLTTLVTLAPLALQLLHLLMADLVWIGLVLTCASAWTVPDRDS